MKDGIMERSDGELLKWLFKQSEPINDRGNVWNLNVRLTMSEAVTLYALGNKIIEMVNKNDK